MNARNSIATRLFLWLFCLGLAALLIGGGGLYLEARNIIFSGLDLKLMSDMEIFTGLLHIENSELEFELAEVTTGNFSIPLSGHYYQVQIDGQPNVDSVSLAGERLRLSPDQLDTQDTERHFEVHTTVGPAGEPLRAMARSLIVAGHATRIIVAHSMEDSITTLRRFRNILLAFGAIGTLLMACVGWTISRRAVIPLRNFSDRINQISEQTLDRRIDVERQPRELSNLADAFNRMLDRLQKSLSAREELLSNVSHTLKTPVTVIRTHCDVYLQKERPSAEYVEALGIIRETADAMGRKVRRLLAMAQTEADLMHGSGVRSLALDECLRKARVTIEPLARERRIEISERITPGLTILGHGERLVEAFSNLLENAVKYNQQGGSVTIFADKRADLIQIRIEDSGCGIGPGEINQVFKRFYRGSSAGQTEGTGLGLFLVKKIIEANRGRIEVDSRKEAGTTFTVSLPPG